MSREWLANSRQRKLKNKRLRVLVNAMKKGNWEAWQETRPIKIREGEVRDGYYRLSAITEVDKPVEMLVEIKGGEK